MRAVSIWFSIWLLGGCTSIPDGVQPVSGFELDRYLGRWYEIARLDHSFERGLQGVTADYSLREDGGVRVVNSGVSEKDGRRKQAEGKAYFAGDRDVAYLEVSFFGPFYGSYIVFDLDREEYRHAFVSGPNKSYLWLLSRTPTVSEELIKKFVEKSEALGFNTDSLIFVKHDIVQD